jgi:hypothetical protein
MQWTPPDHPEDLRNLSCYFSQPPAERSLLTISLEAAAVSAPGGGSRLGGVGPAGPGWDGAGRSPVPIQGPDREYTLDFVFDREAMDPPEFVMTLEPGIEWMLFNSVTLHTAPLVGFPVLF